MSYARILTSAGTPRWRLPFTRSTACSSLDAERRPCRLNPKRRWVSTPVSVIVPPRSSAVPSDTAQTAPTMRARHLQIIAERGRMAWQKARAITGVPWWRLTSVTSNGSSEMGYDPTPIDVARARSPSPSPWTHWTECWNSGVRITSAPRNGRSRWPGCGRLATRATQSPTTTNHSVLLRSCHAQVNS